MKATCMLLFSEWDTGSDRLCLRRSARLVDCRLASRQTCLLYRGADDIYLHVVCVVSRNAADNATTSAAIKHRVIHPWMIKRLAIPG